MYKFRLVPRLILGVLAIPAGLASYEYAIERVWLSRNPPPGQMVDIGGYRLHLNCSGKGAPVVILEAGLGIRLLSGTTRSDPYLNSRLMEGKRGPEVASHLPQEVDIRSCQGL